MSGSSSKILCIDLESAPALVYTFQAYDVNISPDQVVDPVRVLCFAAQWVGEKDIMFYSEWTHGRTEMLLAAHELLSEADAVVGYNSRRFDIPLLRGEFAIEGLKDIPPPTHIDVYKTIKQFGFMIKKLAFVGPLLNLGSKVKHEGFSLWRSVLEGDPRAQKRMERYCIGDVRLTTKLYQRVKGFIVDHPHLDDTKGDSCGSCGGTHLQSRGHRRTKYFKVQRLQCTSCGGWQTGQRTKIGA